MARLVLWSRGDMPHARRKGSRPWTVSATLAVACAAGAFALAASPGQQGVFRAAVDVVAVDVQVIDRDGQPVTALTPDKFSVTIDGRRRRVVSADLVQYAQHAQTASAGEPGSAVVAPRPSSASGDSRAGRVFMLAVDVFSFNAESSRAVVGAAKGFVDELGDNDLIGLYTFPIGVSIAPTTDHGAVVRRIDTIVGRDNALTSSYNLSTSEIIDIVADMNSGGRAAAPGVDATVTRQVMARECYTPNDPQCRDSIQTDAQGLALYLETRIEQAVTGLRAIIQQLGGYPGRKTVVVLSGGMPVSDRLGGRPEIGATAGVLGQEAARSNTVVYAVHIDREFLQSNSAERRRSPRGVQNVARENALAGRLLDAFADASGGAYLGLVMGGGEQAFSRILRETSAHYLLGVEPADADRDGRPRRLSVKVDSARTTVRSRQWVIVPKRGV